MPAVGGGDPRARSCRETVLGSFEFLALVAVIAFGVMAWQSRKLDVGWLVVTVCLIFWTFGLAFYLYEANLWNDGSRRCNGVTRARWKDFFMRCHAASMKRLIPTDIIHNPMRFVSQLEFCW